MIFIILYNPHGSITRDPRPRSRQCDTRPSIQHAHRLYSQYTQITYSQ